MGPELKPGDLVLHPEFGSGVTVSITADRVEIAFKLRGSEHLVREIAESVLTVRETPAPALDAPAAIAGSGI